MARPGLTISNSAASLPKNALALFISPLKKQLAPDGSSEYGGNGRSEVQPVSGSVASLPSVSARLIAVVGRQKPQRPFSAKQLMALSAVAMLVMGLIVLMIFRVAGFYIGTINDAVNMTR